MANTLNLGDGNWATKEDLLLGYNSENNNYKPLPFDFSRASSATRVNKDGLIETVGGRKARVDYKDDSKGALLLEPQRTNLFLNSEDFSQGWSKTGVTVTTNQTISPSEDLTADKFISNSTNQPRVEKSFAVPSSNTTYTFSVFVKKANTRYIALSRFSGGQGAIFDLDTKSVVSSSAENASIKEMSNGWFRISITQTVLSTDGNNIWKINGTNGSSFSDGIVGDETFIWGAQLEVGSYTTSYIPTNGSTVQRAAETANGSGNSEVFNDSEGVLFADISALADGGSTRVISLSGGSQSVNRCLY